MFSLIMLSFFKKKKKDQTQSDKIVGQKSTEIRKHHKWPSKLEPDQTHPFGLSIKWLCLVNHKYNHLHQNACSEKNKQRKKWGLAENWDFVEGGCPLCSTNDFFKTKKKTNNPSFVLCQTTTISQTPLLGSVVGYVFVWTLKEK